MLDKFVSIRPLDRHDAKKLLDPEWAGQVAYDLGFRGCVDLLKQRATDEGLL